MSELKSTPGPWRAVDCELIGADNNTIAAFVDCGSVEVNTANAHLAAASSDLYEALEALLETCHAESHGESERRAAIAALSKARGES